MFHHGRREVFMFDEVVRLKGRIGAALLVACATLACFDGELRVGPGKVDGLQKVSVVRSGYLVTKGQTFVALTLRSGWNGWRDAARSRDRLVDTQLVLRVQGVARDARDTAPLAFDGYSFIISDHVGSGGWPVFGNLDLRGRRKCLELTMDVGFGDGKVPPPASLTLGPDWHPRLRLGKVVVTEDSRWVTDLLNSSLVGVQPRLREWAQEAERKRAN
jgi:hypothetical protein